MAARSDIEAGRAFVRLYVKNADFKRGLNEARRSFNQLGTALESVGRKMMTLGLAGSLPIVLATDRFSKFDDMMLTVQAVAESTTEKMKVLREENLKLSGALGFSAVAVGELMVELGRAGYAADEIGKATKAVLDLARASGTDATLAAGILNQTLNQFRLGTKDAVRVADMLTVTSNKTISTV